jgi:hypothetical protein
MLNDPLFKFDPQTHEYSYAGVVWPSVTQLLQEFGLVDLSNVPAARLEYKRVLGTAVDLACHYLDKRVLDEEKLSEPLVPFVEGYKKFCEITGFEVDEEKSAVPMFSKKLSFCGTNDMVGLLEGELVLIDRKATWKIYKAVGIQTAGYKILCEENFGVKIKKRFALQLKETGNYELEQFKDPQDQNLFLACLALHYWKKKNAK